MGFLHQQWVGFNLMKMYSYFANVSSRAASSGGLVEWLVDMHLLDQIRKIVQWEIGHFSLWKGFLLEPTEFLWINIVICLGRPIGRVECSVFLIYWFGHRVRWIDQPFLWLTSALFLFACVSLRFSALGSQGHRTGPWGWGAIFSVSCVSLAVLFWSVLWGYLNQRTLWTCP
jgi:hypothetical protein